MFSGARNNLFTGGTFNVHMHGATIGGFERLQQAVAPSAFHDAGDILDPPKCHPNTRTAVINKIMDWILGHGVDDQNAVILWFHGPAGAGKSAIVYNVAESFSLAKLLLASFFFSRSDPTRSNAKSLIATISYQIAINVPEAREKIIAAIEHDPLVLTRSLEAQVVALVVDPLRELLVAGYFNTSSSQRLVIIDGLDECDAPTVQCKILDIISILFRKYHLPLLILVASRPERHLLHSFNSGSLLEFHTTLGLDSTYRPDDDIRVFLSDNFQRIKATHPMKAFLDPSWPSVDVLDRLIRKSSGQFIYASTVVKYVSSILHQPADRLNVVLGIRPPRYAWEMPFGELDALYSHILACVDDREMVLLILGLRLLSRTRYPGPMSAVDFERFFLLNKGDIVMLFGDISSIITVNDEFPFIHILHASLPDFLCDAARSREFYIDFSSIHTTCMHLCFQRNKQYSMPHDAVAQKHFTYAALNLIWHCRNTPLSAFAQVQKEILDFSLLRPGSCFANAGPGECLIFYVPTFLSFIKTLPIADADEVYSRNLGVVLNFFTSKLHPYYSSSRLTLLLTFLSTIQSDYLGGSVIPLPSRLKMVDNDGLSLHGMGDLCPVEHLPEHRHIFQDFLDSGDPLALDGQRYATATLACLKIILERHQAPVSRVRWLSQHSRTRRASIEDRFQRHHTDLPPGTDWTRRVNFYWHLKTSLSSRSPQGMPEAPASYLHHHYQFRIKIHDDRLLASHLEFLLEKAAYSDNLLNFAHRKVFRFGYLDRKHPTYIKRAIFALAKYIQRGTGGTAEVGACELIWGRNRWFTAR